MPTRVNYTVYRDGKKIEGSLFNDVQEEELEEQLKKHFGKGNQPQTYSGIPRGFYDLDFDAGKQINMNPLEYKVNGILFRVEFEEVPEDYQGGRKQARRRSSIKKKRTIAHRRGRKSRLVTKRK
jgi:hypothetical protein